MKTTRTHVLLLSLAAALPACSSSPSSQSGSHKPSTSIADLPVPQTPSGVNIDGEMNDWPGDTAVLADTHYLYFRFSFPKRAFTVQNAPKPVVILIDADNDANTGQRPLAKGLKGMGVDLELIFSGNETEHRGVAAYSVSNDGVFTPINPYDLDFVCAPTVAAPWYEARISRSAAALAPLPTAGLRTMGNACVAVGIIGSDENLGAYSDPGVVTLPPADAPGAGLADVLLPAKPAGAVRLVSWNVERSAPTKDPQAFRRILQVLEPDVLQVQEWDTGSADDVGNWMTQWVSSQVQWNVVKADGDLNSGGGVAIISPFPLEKKLMSPPLGGAGGSPVRFVSASVMTPIGAMLVGSTHLKCCGHLDSPEDQRRLAEAQTINKSFLFSQAPALRVITGDMNLVGSRPPLDALAAGLDADGSDLAVAPTPVLGDRATVTWGRSGDPFAPGRLDYILYSDASLRIVNSFVLDTRRLSGESLARLGLDRTDSDASDHMPLVIDVLPAQ